MGGTGLIPKRSRDNWGASAYYDAPSTALKESLALLRKIKNEQGLEVFYNFAMTPWLNLGADLQVIHPSFGNSAAVFPGLRTVIRF